MKAIVNGTIMTITNGTIENGTVLYEDGKITAVGKDLPVPEGTEVIDATGMIVTPGLIDAHTHICIYNEPRTMPGLCLDLNEYSDPTTPQIRAIDSINPCDPAIAKARTGGFTTVYTGPGSANIMGGLGIAMKLRGHTAEEMVIPGTEAMKCALGENPKRFYGQQNKMPVTRMGNAAVLRNILFEAKLYSDELLEAEKDPSKKVRPNFKLDNLVPVVRGERRVRIHCHRADDIVTAIRIGKEYHLDFTIEHATEGYLVKDVIAENHVPCVVGPHILEPEKMELWGLSFENAGQLVDAGVKICLTADTGGNTCLLPGDVGRLLRRGLKYEDAMKALTINPAELLKLGDRVGSIEAGKDADFAIFDGDPLSNQTLCRKTIIDGKVEFEQ